MIDLAHIFCILVTIVISLGLPVLLLIRWRQKTTASWLAAITGAVVFLFFSLVLEQLLHRVVLKQGSYVATHTWAYVLYAGLAAGLFEETGRFIAVHLMTREKEESVMYGIGHGGLESILLCAVPMIATLCNHSAETTSLVMSAPASVYLVGGVERIIAIALQIALSVIVYRSLFSFRWYPIAIILHAAVDWIAMFYRIGILTNVWFLELLVAAATLLVSLLARHLYQSMR